MKLRTDPDTIRPVPAAAADDPKIIEVDRAGNAKVRPEEEGKRPASPAEKLL